MTQTTQPRTPDYLQHDDLRAAAILLLAQLAAENDKQTADTLTAAVPAIVPNVPAADAQATFKGIYQDLEQAIVFDTYGADAVRDYFDGRTWDAPGQDADEKASELCAEHRQSARFNVDMLVTLHDARARS